MTYFLFSLHIFLWKASQRVETASRRFKFTRQVAKRLFLCASSNMYRYCEHINSAGHSLKFGGEHGEGFHTRVSHLHAAEIHCVLRPCELSITSLGLSKKTDSLCSRNLFKLPLQNQKDRREKSSSLVYGPQYFQHIAPVQCTHGSRRLCSTLALSNSISSVYPNYLVAQLTL